MRNGLITAKITEDHLNVLEGEHFNVATEVKEWNKFLIIFINQPEYLDSSRHHSVKSGEF